MSSPEDVLNRAPWSALTGRQTHLAQGDARAVRFDPAYGVFAAARDDSPESQAALVALCPADGAVWLAEPEPATAPPGLTVVERGLLHQMVAETLTAGAADFAIEPLTDTDAPQMLALATLTKPGPFFARTHQLGRFVGVKANDQLIAMAGERMQPTGFTEVSGVCTHPDHRGRGYAGGLMRVVASAIIARGETPFLHSYAHNTGAIALYESLGFRFRREIHITAMARG